MVNTQIMNSVNTWGLDVFSAATLIKVYISEIVNLGTLFFVVFLISIVINKIYIKLT